jgi:hypothetical protein
MVCETRPLEAHVQSREQPKVTRSEIRTVRWLGDARNDFRGEEVATMEDIKQNATAELRNIPEASAGVSNNGRIEGESVCVCVCVHTRVIL